MIHSAVSELPCEVLGCIRLHNSGRLRYPAGPCDISGSNYQPLSKYPNLVRVAEIVGDLDVLAWTGLSRQPYQPSFAPFDLPGGGFYSSDFRTHFNPRHKRDIIFLAASILNFSPLSVQQVRP